MMTVKLSGKPCISCGSKEDTVVAKNKEQDFSGVVCPKHMIGLLKKWEGFAAEAKTSESETQASKTGEAGTATSAKS